MLPEKNVYWKKVTLDMPVYDKGSVYVAGDGEDAAVVNWDGNEAKRAQSYLSLRARLTAQQKK